METRNCHELLLAIVSVLQEDLSLLLIAGQSADYIMRGASGLVFSAIDQNFYNTIAMTFGRITKLTGPVCGPVIKWRFLRK
jgi:hypothetical protein